MYPALAVAAAFNQLHADAEITFLGTELGFEGKLVQAAGQRLVIIPGSPLFGSGVSGKLRAAFNVVAGMSAARRILEERGIEALLSFGGYASAGSVLAARRLGLPLAICEPNVVPGLTNRLLARCATEVFLGWPAAAAAFGSSQVRVTGVPIRAALSQPRSPRSRVRTGPTRILVLGGSLGSRFLNQRVPEAIRRLAERGRALEVQHQAGRTGAAAVRDVYRAHSIQATVTPFLDEIVAAYDWADLAITSAGAITLAEVAAAALPAFVVPFAAASENHQAANAREFAASTGCPWMTEGDWNETTVVDILEGWIEAPERRAELSARLSDTANPDAAAAIARACDRLMVERGRRSQRGNGGHDETL